MIALHVSLQLAQHFQTHTDAVAIRQIGLLEGELNRWVRGTRLNADFNQKLRRLWSALFMKDVCLKPNLFEEICKRYGFDRGMALELSGALATRCTNLRSFCQVSPRKEKAQDMERTY